MVPPKAYLLITFTGKVHESRQPLGKKDLTTMMGTIQRQLRLRPGGDGEWTADAQQRLENLLANLKRKAATTAQLAMEDKKPSSSSSTSDSDSSSSDSDDPSSPDASAELALTKTKLEEKSMEASKWKEEFEGIFSALHHTSSELEKANAQQKEVIARLSQENAALRRQLQPENAVDVPMDESSASESSEPEMTSDWGRWDKGMW